MGNPIMDEHRRTAVDAGRRRHQAVGRLRRILPILSMAGKFALAAAAVGGVVAVAGMGAAAVIPAGASWALHTMLLYSPQIVYGSLFALAGGLLTRRVSGMAIGGGLGIGAATAVQVPLIQSGLNPMGVNFAMLGPVYLGVFLMVAGLVTLGIRALAARRSLKNSLRDRDEAVGTVQLGKTLGIETNGLS